MPHLALVEKGSEKSHRVEGLEVLVGRDPACGVFLEGDEAKTVSGRHARFFFDDNKWYVEDAGSRNGTFVGRRKLEPGTRHALAVGDVIGLGLTGTQLTVREAVGRGFAATLLEAAPAPARGGAGATEPLRTADAPPNARDDRRDEDVRVVLRGLQSGSRSIGQGARVTIGRALECLIRVEGESATSVSRVHAEISAVGEQLTLRDGGSRHGTFLNNRKIETPMAVKQGDVIMLGPGGPTFTLEEVSIVPAAAGGSPSSVSTPAREPAIGPTGVRAAASKAPQSVVERPEKTAFNGPQPTPLDQPAFHVPTPERDQPAFRKKTPPQPQPARRQPTPREAQPRDVENPGRFRGVVIAGVLLVVVVVVVFLLL